MRSERKLPRCVERTIGGKYRAKLARKGRPVKWTHSFDTARQAASALAKLRREILDEEAGIAVRMTADPGNLFVRRFVIFMTLTGLRAGEAARLTFDDVDWERRQIRINLTKMGRGRAVPLPDEAVEILRLIRKGTNDNKNPRRLVFPGKGGAMQEHPHKRAVYAAFEKAGIKGNGNLLHAFRHYYCSKLLESGASLTVAKNLMGHASLRMLDTYAHLFDGQKEQAVARLSRSNAQPGQINPLPDTNRQEKSPLAVHLANRTPSPQPAGRSAWTGAETHGATPKSENASHY